MPWLGAILGFLQALPELIKIYKSIKVLFEDNYDKVVADLETSAELMRKSNDAKTIEEKRAIRKEALLAGANMWSRIAP